MIAENVLVEYTIGVISESTGETLIRRDKGNFVFDQERYSRNNKLACDLLNCALDEDSQDARPMTKDELEKELEKEERIAALPNATDDEKRDFIKENPEFFESQAEKDDFIKTSIKLH